MLRKTITGASYTYATAPQAAPTPRSLAPAPATHLQAQPRRMHETHILACFVNCTLIRQHPCPRVACYCAFAAQSGGGWWLAGEGARCLSVRGTRTLFRDRAGRGSNPCPGFLPGRTRVTCSRVSHLRDFALLGSVSVTVVRWCLLFPPARASSSRQLCLGLASYGPVLRVSSIAH